MADPSYEPGRPGEITGRGLRESRAVDTESLCVLSGKLVWAIPIDIPILDNGGNLVDAANIAALAALLTFRRPECILGGGDGQQVVVHPPEVDSYNTERTLQKIKHHSSVALDASCSAVRLEEKQSQSDGKKGGVRVDQLKSKDEGSSMECDATSSKVQSNIRDGVSKNFIGGSWSWYDVSLLALSFLVYNVFGNALGDEKT